MHKSPPPFILPELEVAHKRPPPFVPCVPVEGHALPPPFSLSRSGSSVSFASDVPAVNQSPTLELGPNEIRLLTRPHQQLSEPPAYKGLGEFRGLPDKELPPVTERPAFGMSFPSLVKKTRKYTLKVVRIVDTATVSSAIKAHADILVTKKQAETLAMPKLKLPISMEQLVFMASALARGIHSS